MFKPVRIARIVTRLGVGGVERHVCSLTANLDHDRFQSWLICGRAEKNDRECLEFARDTGVEPVFIESLRRSLGTSGLECILRASPGADAHKTADRRNAPEQGWRSRTERGALEVLG